MTEASDLLPCPFCGNASKPKIFPFEGKPRVPGYVIRCDASGFSGPEKGCGAESGWGDTPGEAATAWNRRALTASPPVGTVGLDVEELAFQRALDQWRASLKRTDLKEEDRVKGALLAYQRQVLACDMLSRASLTVGTEPKTTTWQIKPLEWVARPIIGGEDRLMTKDGRYWLSRIGGGFMIIGSDEEDRIQRLGSEIYPTAEAAQAVVQADHERRIAAYLFASPSPAGDQGSALEAADRRALAYLNSANFATDDVARLENEVAGLRRRLEEASLSAEDRMMLSWMLAAFEDSKVGQKITDDLKRELRTANRLVSRLSVVSRALTSGAEQ